MMFIFEFSRNYKVPQNQSFLRLIHLKGAVLCLFSLFFASQQRGYNTRNGYMPKVSGPRTEWGRNKTYQKQLTIGPCC